MAREQPPPPGQHHENSQCQQLNNLFQLTGTAPSAPSERIPDQGESHLPHLGAGNNDYAG